MALILICGSGLWAQEQTVDQQSLESAGGESAVLNAEQEMTTHLKELEELEQERAEIEKTIGELSTLLEDAAASGDMDGMVKAKDNLRTAESSLSRVQEQISATLALYKGAAESYRIASQEARLAKESKSAGSQKTPLTEAMQLKEQARRTEKEVELAEKKIATIQENIGILNQQQEGVNEDINEISKALQDPNVNAAQRLDLMKNHQRLLEQEQELEDKLASRRQELVAAKVEQRIKLDKAAEEVLIYKKWRKKIIRSLVFIAIVITVLMILRMIVSNRIKTPHRRYYLNRSLSILMVFVVLIGLLVIFVRDFAYLVTGMGVVLAGLAIALQELLASFFAWFLIQSAKGYRVRDWIRVGEQYGEVVDIGLLTTVLAQVSPIADSGDTGGRWTGGLTLFSNSAIFKHPLINYTKGYPFMWCAITYTITFESNWKNAETMIAQAAVDKEISHAARQAAKNIDEMTTRFAIKVRDTEPSVRARIGASGVHLTLRFLAHPRRRRLLMDKINRQVLEAVSEAEDVELAYDTIRVIPTVGKDAQSLGPARV